MLFIPHDAIVLSEVQEAGWKTFNAKCAGSVFDGAKLTAKLFLNRNENWQGSQCFPFEVIAGARTSPPISGSEINLSLDQSLVRFVK